MAGERRDGVALGQCLLDEELARSTAGAKDDDFHCILLACRITRSVNDPAYQGRGLPWWINVPVGPSAGKVARAAEVFPPSLSSMGAWSPPISVLTQPG